MLIAREFLASALLGASLLMVLPGCAAPAGTAPAGEGQMQIQRLVLRLRQEPANTAAAAVAVAELGQRHAVALQLERLIGGGYYSARLAKPLPQADLATLLAALRADPVVAEIEPDLAMKSQTP